MGEVPAGALVQAEPALQVNGTAGHPARQLLSVLAQSELRFGHLHSGFFFFSPFIKWEVSLQQPFPLVSGRSGLHLHLCIGTKPLHFPSAF